MDKPPADIVDRYAPSVVNDAPEYCDTCAGSGAYVEAFVFAEMPSGLSVAYCSHHGTKYWVKLNEQAATVIDFRHYVAEQ